MFLWKLYEIIFTACGFSIDGCYFSGEQTIQHPETCTHFHPRPRPGAKRGRYSRRTKRPPSTASCANSEYVAVTLGQSEFVDKWKNKAQGHLLWAWPKNHEVFQVSARQTWFWGQRVKHWPHTVMLYKQTAGQGNHTWASLSPLPFATPCSTSGYFLCASS